MAASGNRILVVDDEPGLADLAAEYLERVDGDLSVTTETSATDALALVRDDGEFDCVVSDYNMPELNGLELLEAVREEHPSLPFVLYTGKGSEEIASEAISAGVTDYVQKGSGSDHYEVLAKRIENAISQHRAEARLRETHAKIEALHQTAAKVAVCTDRTELCELAVEAAEEILAFDLCDISLREGDELVPKAVSKGVPSDGYYRSTPVDADDNFGARVYREGESLRIEDLREHGVDPAESDYRSALNVPIDDHGVFQAVSRELDGFSDRDRELAELLLAHVSAALDRLNSEEKLRDERDKFAALFRNIPHAIGVGTFEEDNPVIREANPAFESVFGWDIDDIAGQAIDDRIVPDSEAARRKAAEINERMRNGEYLSGVEVRRLTADGPRDFLLHTVCAPNENANGFVIYTDITEQKRRERELQRQNAHLDEFVSILSHDLRDSLEVIGANARRFDSHDDEPVERIREAMNRIEDRVEEALDLAEQGRTVREPTSVSLPAVVEAAWETVETQDATLSMIEPPSEVAGDRLRLGRLFKCVFRDAVASDASVAVEVSELDGGTAAGRPGRGSAERRGPEAESDRQDSEARVDEYDSEAGLDGQLSGADASERSDSPVSPSGLYVEFESPDDGPHSFEAGGADLRLRVIEDLARAHGWSVRTADGEDGGLRVEFDFETDGD